jgi:hypothetical protein
MTSSITYMAAREHANELLREAQRVTRVRQPRTAGRPRFRLPRFIGQRTARAAAVGTQPAGATHS